MRHLSKIKQFGRKKDQRKALMRSLAENLIIHEKIKTTEVKAKELRSFIEPLITRAKYKTLASQRQFAKLFKCDIRRKLFELGVKYKERPGGYTRITKLGTRKSDSAKMVIINFV